MSPNEKNPTTSNDPGSNDPGSNAPGLDPFSSTASLPLLVRMPDGERHQVDIPPNASIKDLKSTIAGMDTSLNDPTSSAGPWDLDFGGSILNEKHTLQHYNIPDAYDHANGLLKTISDSGYIDPDKKVEALDKAVAVVQGISRGEHDMERLINAAFEEQDADPTSPGAQPSLRAMRRSRRSRIPSLNFAHLPPAFPLPSKSTKPSLPSAPPTPSQLIRRLSTSRPDLYDPSAVPADANLVSPRRPPTSGTVRPSTLTAPATSTAASTVPATSSSVRKEEPAESGPTATAPSATAAPSTSAPGNTTSALGGNSRGTGLSSANLGGPGLSSGNLGVPGLSSIYLGGPGMSTGNFGAPGSSTGNLLGSGDLKRENTWFTEVISSFGNSVTNHDKQGQSESDEDEVEGDSEDDETNPQTKSTQTLPGGASANPVSSIPHASRNPVSTTPASTNPALKANTVATSSAIGTRATPVTSNAIVTSSGIATSSAHASNSTVGKGGTAMQSLSKPMPSTSKPSGFGNGMPMSSMLRAPVEADSSNPAGDSKSEPPKVHSPNGTIKSGVTSTMSASSAPESSGVASSAPAPGDPSRNGAGSSAGATSEPAGAGVSGATSSAMPLGKSHSQVMGLTSDMGNTIVGPDGKLRKKRGRKRKNPHLSEEERKAQRQAQNRESAKLSRIRRKNMTMEYEKRVTTLEGENENLRDTVLALTDRLEMLQNLLTISVQKRTVPTAAIPQIAAATQQQVEAQLAGVPSALSSRAMPQGPIAAARQLNAAQHLGAPTQLTPSASLATAPVMGLPQAPVQTQQQGAFATQAQNARGTGSIAVSSAPKRPGQLTNLNLDFNKNF